MKMMYEIRLFLAVIVLFMPHTFVEAGDKVTYIPLVGAVGNAMVNDVVKGKTFSSKAGTGLTGTLVVPPNAQTYTNSVGMIFNLIPTGTFTMGSPVTEPDRDGDETQHQVFLSKSFYMQVTEITNKQWNAVIVDKGRGESASHSHTGNEYPMDNVNWYEAASFANWLSYDEGLLPCYSGSGTCTGTLGDDYTCTLVTYVTGCTGYRLPTEAQWEYAARATTTTAYANPYSFDTTDTEIESGFSTNLHDMGWYSYNREMKNPYDVAAYPDGTKPVAQKQANRWGLYDMHGNVYEWCQDWYATYPVAKLVTDPQGPESGSFRVQRSGAWLASAGGARAANRTNSTPDSRSRGYLGFRLVLPLDQ